MCGEERGTEAAPAGEPVPIDRVVDPAVVRRAPRHGVFLVSGAIVGLVLGLAVGISWWLGSGQFMAKSGVTVTVIVASGAALGTLIAGAWVVFAERRSLRGRPRS